MHPLKFINSLKWDFDACGAADSAGRSAAAEYRGHYIVLFYKDPQHEKRIHFHFIKNRLERAQPASTLPIGMTSTLQKRRGCCLYIYKISSVIDSSKGVCSRIIIIVIWQYLVLSMAGLFVCFDNSA
jgi:hypothetical protein